MRSEIYMRKIIVEVGQKVYFDPFADVALLMAAAIWLAHRRVRRGREVSA